jgi:hypothetical protein
VEGELLLFKQSPAPKSFPEKRQILGKPAGIRRASPAGGWHNRLVEMLIESADERVEADFASAQMLLDLGLFLPQSRSAQIRQEIETAQAKFTR